MRVEACYTEILIMTKSPRTVTISTQPISTKNMRAKITLGVQNFT